MKVQRTLRVGAMALAATALTACDGGPSSGGALSKLIGGVTGQPTLPKEIGAFALQGGTWQRLIVHDYESYFGGYLGTENADPNQFPALAPGSRVVFNKVPLNPANVYVTSKVIATQRPEQENRLDTNVENGDAPASVIELEPGVYEVNISNLSSGLHAVVIKDGRFSFRAIFFRIT